MEACVKAAAIGELGAAFHLLGNSWLWLSLSFFGHCRTGLRSDFVKKFVDYQTFQGLRDKALSRLRVILPIKSAFDESTQKRQDVRSCREGQTLSSNKILSL